MNSDWTNLRGPITGLQPVDLAYRDLMGDLQAVSVAENAQEAHAVTLSLPPLRRAALALVDVARETHEAMAAEQDAPRARLHVSSGTDLIGLWATVSGRLQAALHWVPSDRRQRLRETVPGFTEFLRRLERLNWAYLAVAYAWEYAVPRAQGYAQFLDIHTELEREHSRRWHSRLRPALAASLLAIGPENPRDEANAVKLLDTYLPLAGVRKGKYRGTPEERTKDFPQDIRLRLIELIAELQHHSPEALLARMYDGDQSLLYLPHAATQDFRNQRKKIDPHDVSMGNIDEGYEDLSAINRLSTEHYRDLILSQFVHTETERKILEIVLADPTLDPRDRDFASQVACKAGCARETVSRYLSKLRKHNPSILKSFLEK